jgi:hypothetical protein
MRRFARPGDRMVVATVEDEPDVRAYAVARTGGYAVLLVNINRTRIAHCSIMVRGGHVPITASRRFVYDAGQYAMWSGPREEAVAPVSGDGAVALTPWSITLLEFEKNG